MLLATETMPQKSGLTLFVGVTFLIFAAGLRSLRAGVARGAQGVKYHRNIFDMCKKEFNKLEFDMCKKELNELEIKQKLDKLVLNVKKNGNKIKEEMEIIRKEKEDIKREKEKKKKGNES